MRYLAFILFLLVSAGLAVLVYENFSTDVSLSLVVWQTPNLPIGLFLFVSYLLGALLLYIISATSAWRDVRLVRTLRKRVQELELAQAQQAQLQQIRVQSGPLPETGGSATANPSAIVPMPGMPSPNISEIPTQH
jgi:uncharacterized integral membrane protein